MKKLFLLLLLTVSVSAYCQTTEKQYYIYNIVSFNGDFDEDGIKMKLDNGVEIKRYRGEKGKKVTFKTPAGALMYLLSQGWEIFMSGSTETGKKGDTETNSYWILRKPCTKSEFDKAVNEACK
ncbi:MAG: hypothetical protein J5610_05120 [Prevotella sp.]|nr:hypothetical protein [Prevotella sp.]